MSTMSRTDAHGRGLEAVLSYMLNRPVQKTELHQALGIARNTYFNRSKEEDFPNAEECRRIAEHFDLNPIELQLTFGLVAPADVEDLLPGKAHPHGLATMVSPAPPGVRKLAKLTRKKGVPPL